MKPLLCDHPEFSGETAAAGARFVPLRLRVGDLHAGEAAGGGVEGIVCDDDAFPGFVDAGDDGRGCGVGPGSDTGVYQGLAKLRGVGEAAAGGGLATQKLNAQTSGG